MGDATSLKRTPLYAEHEELDAKLVPFAGWAMPVQYPSGIRAEHKAVRERAGLFDVSHMGEFRIRGPEALDFVSFTTTNDPHSIIAGQAQYSAMCFSDGGVVDDLLVYRIADDDVRLVVNASNIAKDWAHLDGFARQFEVRMEDESDQVALLAVQGPVAQSILAGLTSRNLEEIGYYHFAWGEVAGVEGMISRTGYTGEDGFELYVPADRAAELWRAILNHGGAHGLVPAGLGARDSLRLEMGYALYGNDIDQGTTPLEAGLGWLVKLDKGDFVGREALVEQKAAGVPRRLRGFRLEERGFPRPGYEVHFDGEAVGEVRSGTLSPSLGYGIGMAYLPPDAGFDSEIAVVIRDQAIPATVVRPPFYQQGSVRR